MKVSSKTSDDLLVKADVFANLINIRGTTDTSTLMDFRGMHGFGIHLTVTDKRRKSYLP